MKEWIALFIVSAVAFVWIIGYLDNQEKKRVEPQILKAYQDGYDAGVAYGIYEGIKRSQVANKEELPLPVDDQPGCDLTPEKPKVNYLERLKTK